MGLTLAQANAMNSGQYLIDDLVGIEGAETVGSPSYKADTVLGGQIDAERINSGGFQMQGGWIIDSESAGTTVPTTTSSVPVSGTTTSVPSATTSVPITTTTIPATTTTLPAVTTSIAVKHPPTITGTPPSKVSPGVFYSFVPTASDVDGDALAFSIKNMPPWASFNTTTGALTGTPAAKDYGIYGLISISVIAGSDTVDLPTFEISVADSINPAVVINYPTDGSAFNAESSLSAISGSITDPSGVGMSKIELQITDGTLYLVGESGTTQGLVPNNSSWVLAKTTDEWKSWYFVTSNTLWQSGKTYTVTARATDKTGKSTTTTSKFTYTDKIVVSGAILDGNKKPIQDVTLTFADDNKRTSTIISDTAGKYQWIVPNSGWSGKITPTKPGYTFTPAELSMTSISTNQLNSNFTATAVESEQDARAIIVAGGDLEDFLWPATKSVANFAYTVLRKKGILKENIRYLSMDTTHQDLDNDKINDIDGLASSTELEKAIANWAGAYVNSKKPLILYMVDHGLEGQFLITKPRHGQADILTSAKLQEWLNALQTKTGAKVIFIMDSCYSGSFVHELIPPKGMSRIVITSTDTKELAYFASDGDQSFSGFFWKHILMGKNLRDSFSASVQASRAASRNQQNPIMDADSDGLYSASKDKPLVSTTYLGTPFFTAAVFPEITDSIPDSYMEEKGAGLTFWVQLQQDASKMDRVWGVVVPPGANHDSQDPITNLPILALKFNAATKRYEATFDSTFSGFKGTGQYVVSFYAQANDGEKWTSLPKSVTIQVGQDEFEPDNTPAQASIIVLNDPNPQHHNTHLANDVDWVKFYGIKDVTYAIEAINLGKNADLVLELFDPDGVTPIMKAVNDNAFGVTEKITFTASKNGVYFVKASQFAANLFGSDTEYDLKIYRPYGPIVIPLLAYLTNPDNSPMANAVIQTNANETALTDSQGRFRLMTDTSNVTLDLTVNGVQSAVTGVQVKISGKTFIVTPPSTPTPNAPVLDVDKSGTVDATDGVLLLRKLNGASTIDTGVVLPTGQSNTTVVNALNAIGTKLDVDQSGTVDATDGVLILRKLNGASTIDTGVVLPTGQTNSSVLTAINALAK